MRGHRPRQLHRVCASGLATAKTLAYALGLPIVGVATTEALRRAAAGAPDAEPLAVVLPAGARDHYLAVPGEAPRLVPPGGARGAALGGLIARSSVRALDSPTACWATTPSATRRGAPWPGCPARCWRSLDERLAAGASDDVATLVPPTWRCRGASPAAAGRWHGRPTSAEAARRAHDASTDIPDVHDIERASFPVPWPAYAFRQELETNRLAHYLVVRAGDETVAYGGIWLMVDEAHVTTFAVLPAWRRHGIGGAADARDDASSPRDLGARVVTLEVRLCNDAGAARCTSASASGRWASGRATTRTTARTR